MKYEFDDSFLESVGLSGIPDEQKPAFLAFVRDRFETLIGEKMVERLNDAQLAEFEKIANNDTEVIRNLITKAGDYKKDPIYQELLANGRVDGSDEAINDYVTVVWLNQNCPDCNEIFKATMAEVQEEVRREKEGIIGSFRRVAA